MNRFIVLAFVVMGFGYYELSGGSDFVPEVRPDQMAAAETAEPAVATGPDLAGIEVVTRADTTVLDAVPGVDSAVAQAIALEPAVAAEAIPEAPEFIASSVADALSSPEVVAPEPPPAEVAVQQTGATADLREVTGDLVNMRDGPGTGFGVIDRLGRGSVIEVLETGSDSWVRVYVQSSGQSGWMSADFLAPING